MMFHPGNRMSFDLGPHSSANINVKQRIQSIEAKRSSSMSPKYRPSQRIEQGIMRFAEDKAQELCIDNIPEEFSVQCKKEYSSASNSFKSESPNTTGTSISINLTPPDPAWLQPLVSRKSKFSSDEYDTPPVVPPRPANLRRPEDDDEMALNITLYSAITESQIDNPLERPVVPVKSPFHSPAISTPWEYTCGKKESSATLVTEEDTDTSEVTVSSLGQDGPEEIVEKIEKKKSIRWAEDLVEILDIPHVTKEEYEKQHVVLKTKRSFWLRFVCGAN